MDTLTLSGERWEIPVWDGVQLGRARVVRQTMRFRRVAGGYARAGRVYRTFDPAVLARVFRYRRWHATMTNTIGPGRVSTCTLDGENPDDEVCR